MIFEMCFKIIQWGKSVGNGADKAGEAIKGWVEGVGVGTWGWETLHNSLYHYMCLKCSVINREERKKGGREGGKKEGRKEGRKKFTP